MTDEISVANKTGVVYVDMKFLLKLFHKTIWGKDFVEASKRISFINGAVDDRDLWLIWWAFKTMNNE